MPLITCNRCSHQSRISDILRSYGISDQVKVTIEQQYAFCKHCSGAVNAEYVPTLAELNAVLAEFIEANETEWIKGLEERIAWRQTRQSPARCLECGSTDIICAVVDEETNIATLEHPGCGGTLLIRTRGFELNRLWILYTSEGEKTGTYEVFASRGLVKRE